MNAAAAIANILKAEGYVIPAEGGDVRAKEGTLLSFTMLHPEDEVHTKIAETLRTSLDRLMKAV